MTRSTILFSCLVVGLVGLLPAYGCGSATAKTSQITTSPTESTTNVSLSTSPLANTTSISPTTSAVIEVGMDHPVPLTTHGIGTGYAGNCLLCHGPGTTNSNPYPPSWDGKKAGSTLNTGVYPITAGSLADHTNYKSDQCMQAGCHTLGTAMTTTPGTTAPATTAPATTYIPPTITGVVHLDPPIIHTHPIAGTYADCLSCHSATGKDPMNTNKLAPPDMIKSNNKGCLDCHAAEEE
jgi:Doubled CXXCH motif (Paired_CXXCH_1)